MTPNPTTLEDRLVGAFIGLVVGDALGTTLEFEPRPETPVIFDMVGGGPFAVPPGGWTDDTSMALCLADSLIAHPEFDPGDLMRRFVNWWRWGYNSHTGTCFDIGLTTSSALAQFERTGKPFAGSTSPDSAGNGSIMRLAPVVLAYHRTPERMVEVARAQSRTTHGAAECLDDCARLAQIILSEASGNRIVVTSHTRDSVRSSGYVRHTMEAAEWAVATTSDYKAALLAAVNLGVDADTVGAVTGQIAGARYGLSGIPKDWRSRILWGDDIHEKARALLAAVKG